MDNTWMDNYQKAKLIFDRDGTLEFVDENLKSWLTMQRNLWIKGKLDEEKKDMLCRIRYSQQNQNSWFRHYDIAKQYFDKYGTVDVPFIYIDETGYELGRWIHQQKQRYRLTIYPDKYHSSNSMKLFPYQKELLDDLNFIEIHKRSFGTSFPEQALFYYISHIFPDTINRYRDLGFELDLYIPSLRVGIEYDGCKYHKAHNMYLADLEKNKLVKENDITLIRIRESGLAEMNDCICFYQKASTAEWYTKSIEFIVLTLDNIYNTSHSKHIDIDLSRDTPDIMQSFREYGNRIWQRHYNDLLKFYKEHGHIDVPSDSDNPVHKILYKWLHRQRIAKNTPEKSDSKLSHSQIQKLDNLGMEWDHSLVQWTLKYRQLLEYIQINSKNGLRFFSQVNDSQETSIARWLNEQRKAYASGTLNPKCITMLENIGMDWKLVSKLDDNWVNGYSYAKRYYEKYGHLLLSKNDKFEDFNLGVWVQVQRNGYNNIGAFPMPSQKRIDLLNKIGMCWDDLSSARFGFFLKNLKLYINKHDRSEAIPIDYICEQEYPLGKTLHQYYRTYKNGNLDSERLTQIENIIGSFDDVVFLYKNTYKPNDRRALDRKQQRWQKNYTQLKELLAVSPYKNVIITDDKGMYRWCRNLIKDYKNDVLAPAYKKMVNDLKINISQLQVRSTLNYNTWINNFTKLKILVENQIAPNTILSEDDCFNGWLRYTVQKYLNGELLNEQAEQMRALPIQWNTMKITTKFPTYAVIKTGDN